jgi:hypothetical protein
MDTIKMPKTATWSDCQMACRRSTFICGCFNFDQQQWRTQIRNWGGIDRDHDGGSLCTLYTGTGSAYSDWKWTSFSGGTVSNWRENCGSETTEYILAYQHKTLVVASLGFYINQLGGTWKLSGSGCHDNRPLYKHEERNLYLLYQAAKERWVFSTSDKGVPDNTVLAIWPKSNWPGSGTDGPWTQPLGRWTLQGGHAYYLAGDAIDVGFPPPPIKTFKVEGGCEMSFLMGTYDYEASNIAGYTEKVALAGNSRYVFKQQGSNMRLYYNGDCGDWAFGTSVLPCWEGENSLGNWQIKGSKGIATLHTENDPWNFWAGGRGNWQQQTADGGPVASLGITLEADYLTQTPRNVAGCTCSVAFKSNNRGSAQFLTKTYVEELVRETGLTDSAQNELISTLNDYSRLSSTASNFASRLAKHLSEQVYDLAVTAVAVKHGSRAGGHARRWAESLEKHVNDEVSKGKKLWDWYDAADDSLKQALLKLGMFAIADSFAFGDNQEHKVRDCFKADSKDEDVKELAHKAGFALMDSWRTKLLIFRWVLEKYKGNEFCEWNWFLNRRNKKLAVQGLTAFPHPSTWGRMKSRDHAEFARFAEDAIGDLASLAKLLASFMNGLDTPTPAESVLEVQAEAALMTTKAALLSSIETASSLVSMDMDKESGFYKAGEEAKINSKIKESATHKWCGNGQSHTSSWCPRTDSDGWLRQSAVLFKTVWCARQDKHWESCEYTGQGTGLLLMEGGVHVTLNASAARWLDEATTFAVLAKDGATLGTVLDACSESAAKCLEVKEFFKAIADITLGMHGTMGGIWDKLPAKYAFSTMLKSNSPVRYAKIKDAASGFAKVNSYMSKVGKVLHSYQQTMPVDSWNVQAVQVISRRGHQHNINLIREGNDLFYYKGSGSSAKLVKAPMQFNVGTKEVTAYVKGTWVKVGADGTKQMSKMKMMMANVKLAKFTVFLTVVGMAFDAYTFATAVQSCNDGDDYTECDMVTGSMALVSFIGGLITLVVICAGFGPIGLAVGAFLMIGAAVVSILWSIFKPKPEERKSISMEDFKKGWCCHAATDGLDSYMQHTYPISAKAFNPKSSCKDWVTDNCGCDFGQWGDYKNDGNCVNKDGDITKHCKHLLLASGDSNTAPSGRWLSQASAFRVEALDLLEEDAEPTDILQKLGKLFSTKKMATPPSEVNDDQAGLVRHVWTALRLVGRAVRAVPGTVLNTPEAAALLVNVSHVLTSAGPERGMVF